MAGPKISKRLREAKRKAGLVGGARTRDKMLAKDPEYFSKISKARVEFKGGRPRKKKGAKA